MVETASTFDNLVVSSACFLGLFGMLAFAFERDWDASRQSFRPSLYSYLLIKSRLLREAHVTDPYFLSFFQTLSYSFNPLTKSHHHYFKATSYERLVRKDRNTSGCGGRDCSSSSFAAKSHSFGFFSFSSIYYSLDTVPKESRWGSAIQNVSKSLDCSCGKSCRRALFGLSLSLTIPIGFASSPFQICMTLSLLVFAPLGAILARYGRTLFAWSFVHRLFQGVCGLLAIAGLALWVF